MYLIPLTNACILVTLSYIALKLKNLLFMERYGTVSVSLLTGLASILLMLSPAPDGTLMNDFRFAPMVMAGLRFGWRVALPASLLPALYIALNHEEAYPFIEIIQSCVFPALISSWFHRREHQQFDMMIPFADGIKVSALLTAIRVSIGGYMQQEPSLEWFISHVLMLALSTIAVLVLIKMYNEDNRIWMLQRHLELQANQDGLTGLPNLRSFMNMAGHTSRFRPITIMMIDIDNFKKYNDTFGHLQGDTLLQEVGKVLRSAIDEQDYLARYGGEEFILMSHTTNATRLAAYAQQLCDVVASYRSLETASVSITISIGISTARDQQDDLLRIISEADEALYESKHLGKNRFSFFAHPLEPVAAAQTSSFISG